MVIIPVNQPDFLRRLHGIRQIGIQRHIIIFAGRRYHAQIHIRPYHGLQPQFPANIRNPLQMLGHNLRFGMIPVFQKVIAKAQRPGFIHSQMHPPTAERLRSGLDAGLYKIIDLLLPHQKNILRIPGSLHHIPAKRRLQMGKRLNTGNHFNSKQSCVVVALSQFFLRIPAAERAEIRILRHFIGILCVKHHGIHAQRCLDTDILLYRFHIEYTVSGTVQHGTVFIQVHGFLFFKAIVRPFSFQFPYKRHQRTEKERFPAGPEHRFPFAAALFFTAAVGNRHLPAIFHTGEIHCNLHRHFQPAVQHRIHRLGVCNHLMAPFLQQLSHSGQKLRPVIHQLKIHILHPLSYCSDGRPPGPKNRRHVV